MVVVVVPSGRSPLACCLCELGESVCCLQSCGVGAPARSVAQPEGWQSGQALAIPRLAGVVPMRGAAKRAMAPRSVHTSVRQDAWHPRGQVPTDYLFAATTQDKKGWLNIRSNILSARSKRVQGRARETERENESKKVERPHEHG